MSAEITTQKTANSDFDAVDPFRRISLEEMVDYPVHTSLFIMDFALLSFGKHPIFISLVLQGLLVYLSMFFGAKLATGARQNRRIKNLKNQR